MKNVRGGRVAIKVNDNFGPYFPTFAGVRQRDPLSPLLFDIVGDEWAFLIKKLKKKGLLHDWFLIWWREVCPYFNV
jgi:hypothetical protein